MPGSPPAAKAEAGKAECIFSWQYHHLVKSANILPNNPEIYKSRKEKAAWKIQAALFIPDLP
jgi:hypothetical protein